MYFIRSILLIFLLTFSFNSFALGPFHLEALASVGMGKAEVETETESPNMLVYTIGGTFGYNFIPIFYAGATAEMEFINQLSDTNKSHGNRKGVWPSISPTLGASFLSFNFKYQYKLLGGYKLDKKTSTGKEVKYTNSAGHRFTAQYPLFPFVRLGVYFELSKFDNEELAGVEKSLTNKMKLTHYGLVASMVF